MSIWHLIFYILPKNSISYLVGAFTQISFPSPFHEMFNRAFISFYGIDMSEASKGLEEYRSIEDVFTRTLRPGVRRVEGAFVSPADGLLVKAAQLRNGEALQAKDWWYSASELIYGLDPLHHSAVASELTYFATVYLAPHNYHRVHTPVSGIVKSIRHIPGQLWPVNNRFVNLIPKLFIENERLVFEIELEANAKAWVVMVGALNVGRISTPLLPDFYTNDSFLNSGVQSQTFALGEGIKLRAGDELGTFMLGSTVVIVLNRDAELLLQPKTIRESENIQYGMNLSRTKELKL